MMHWLNRMDTVCLSLFYVTCLAEFTFEKQPVMMTMSRYLFGNFSTVNESPSRRFTMNRFLNQSLSFACALVELLPDAKTTKIYHKVRVILHVPPAKFL